MYSAVSSGKLQDCQGRNDANLPRLSGSEFAVEFSRSFFSPRVLTRGSIKLTGGLPEFTSEAGLTLIVET